MRFLSNEHSMAAWDDYRINYHYGGTLVREWEIRYDNGAMVEFIVDPDKSYYWDLIGDLKELGYAI